MEHPEETEHAEFDARGVGIARWPRSLTRSGQVVLRDGRLVLLTSYGREIDSAPVDRVEVRSPWYGSDDRATATLNGTRYLLRLGSPDGLLRAVRSARSRRAADDRG